MKGSLGCACLLLGISLGCSGAAVCPPGFERDARRDREVFAVLEAAAGDAAWLPAADQRPRLCHGAVERGAVTDAGLVLLGPGEVDEAAARLAHLLVHRARPLPTRASAGGRAACLAAARARETEAWAVELELRASLGVVAEGELEVSLREAPRQRRAAAIEAWVADPQRGPKLVHDYAARCD